MNRLQAAILRRRRRRNRLLGQGGLTPYEAAVLALSPDAWWKFNDASGLMAVDSVGGWNAASTAGVTAGQAGAGENTGSSFDHNGSTNDLKVPYSAPMKTFFDYAGAFFVCAWCFPDTYPNSSPRILDYGGVGYLMYVTSTPNITFVISYTGGNVTGVKSGLTTGAWNFVAANVAADGKVTVYIANAANGWTVTAGTQTAAGSGSRNLNPSNNPLYLGNNPARQFDGRIDDLIIGDGNPTIPQLQAVVDAAIPFDLNIPGAWTWFTEPRAQRINNMTVLGAVDPLGNARAYIFDHASDLYRSVILHANLGIDDHNNPAMLVRNSDSRLLAFYCNHLANNDMYMRVSTNPLDAMEWQTEVNLDSALGMDTYTYANPIQLLGEVNDPIWLFFRGIPPAAVTHAQYFSKSEDDGATWAPATRWLDNGFERPYLKVIQNGDSRIDFACTDGHPVEVTGCSVYHGYYQGGNWYKSDGTLVGGVADLPLNPSDFTRIYDGTTVEGWIHDIVIDGSGHPVIAYANFPSTTDHRYRYARWNGSSWSDHEIVAAGTYLYAVQDYYSGGISIDPDDVNTVYLSRETGDGDHEVWRYVTADGGSTWDGTKLTTENGRALRPYVVRNHGSDKKVAYFAGAYTTYTNYDTVIKLIDG